MSGVTWVSFCIMAMATCVDAQVVKKSAENFDHGPWKSNAFSTVGGATSIDAKADGARGGALVIEPNFTGAFGGYGASPMTPLVIPGDAKSVSLRFNLSDARYGVKVSFRDGWGRDRVEGKYLNWTIITKDGINQWKDVSFKIPENWPRPIEIVAIDVDNWEAKTDVRKPRLLVDQIDIETDLAKVDAAGILTTWTPDPAHKGPNPPRRSPIPTPLADISIISPVEGNTFTNNPTATIRLRNWRDGGAAGQLAYRVVDQAGVEVTKDIRPVTFDSQSAVDVLLKPSKFGLYTVVADLGLQDGAKTSRKMTYAFIPKPWQLTEAQKMQSPYGLNYHGAGRLMLKPFQDAGVVWFREYAFSYPWLLQSKGSGDYTNWPNHKRIVQAYKDANAKFIAVLQLAITKPTIENGKPTKPLGPTDEWVRNIAHVIATFPEVTCWEAANEYDHPAANQAAEEAVGWKNYQLYHAKLANLVELISGGKQFTVENGHPGIFPSRELVNVKSGLFDKVAVVNSHHYTGTEPPETNSVNYNTHSGSLIYSEPGLLFDQLRASTRAGMADGKQREHWFTEFGWDTLVGPVVSHHDQAVFLQRGWMLSMAAGCQKAFWFYHFDSEHPAEFFDGCGLYTWDAQPKLAVATLAGLSSILPTPKYVGSIEAGDNTAGWVFEQDGHLVASLFAITGEGPTVDFASAKVFDYLANPLPNTSVKLTTAPMYAVGIAKDSKLYQQTAYSLDTPYLISATAGDVVQPVVLVNNNRTTPIDATVSIAAPEGWSAEETSKRVTVAPGQHQKVTFAIRVGDGTSHHVQTVKFNVAEQGPVRQIELKVNRQPALVMRVPSLAGQPGEAKLNVQVGNNASAARSGTLRLKLPKSWQAKQMEVPVNDLKPGESRAVPIELTWGLNIAADETAMVEFDGGGAVIRLPLIPPQISLARATSIKIDGSLDEWPANTKVPAWMLGSTVGDGNADVRLAWSPEGVHGAVAVRDSKVVNRDPTRFWTGDVLELFLAADEKWPHQFWFVPMTTTGNVYAGRWKMGSEIPGSLFDLKTVQGVSKKTDDGYTMEFFVPADQINGYAPSAGHSLRLNVNLSARGQRINREAYWPRAKRDGVQSQPGNWGTAVLLP
jgi:hypothetical protein